MVKFDHQMNANHTWGIRWLRELSPQRNQAIAPAVGIQVASGSHPRRRRQGPDGGRDSVVGLRQHEGELAARRLDAGGCGVRQSLLQRRTARSQLACDPTLTYQTFHDQQSAVGPGPHQRCLSRLRTRSPGSCPTSAATTTSSSARSTSTSTADNHTQDNLNGTFSFGTSNAPFDPNNPRTYPDRLTIRVPGQSAFVPEGALCIVLRAGQMEDDQPADRDAWVCATTSRSFRCRERTIPISPAKTTIRSTRTTSSRGRPRPTRSTRAGVQLRVADMAGSTTRRTSRSSAASSTPDVFSDSFTANFPASAADAGPRNGHFPTDPFLVNGPVLNRALLDRTVSAWQRPSGTLAT